MGGVSSSAGVGTGELRRMYVEEGLTLAEIAGRLGVAPQTVWNRLRAQSIPTRPSPSTPRSDLDAKEVARLYVEQGMSAPAIARAVGCGVATVYSRLDAAGVSRRPANGARSRRPPVDALRLRYEVERQTVREVAREFAVTRQAVYGWLRDAGIGLRGRDVSMAPDSDEVGDRYRSGETGPELARAYGCSPASIYRLLDECGVERIPFRAIERADLLAGLEAGSSASEIARAQGISVTAVCRALAREGLETSRQAELRVRRGRSSA